MSILKHLAEMEKKCHLGFKFLWRGKNFRKEQRGRWGNNCVSILGMARMSGQISNSLSGQPDLQISGIRYNKRYFTSIVEYPVSSQAARPDIRCSVKYPVTGQITGYPVIVHLISGPSLLYMYIYILYESQPPTIRPRSLDPFYTVSHYIK